MRARSQLRRTVSALIPAAIAISVFGCAQPQNSPGLASNAAPTDHWDVGVVRDGAKIRYANAGIVNKAKDAVLMLGCTEDNKSVLLIVDPDAELPIDPGRFPVTIILDGDTTFIQNWIALPEGYSIADSDPGFTTVIETLKKYKEIEFVLGRPGKDIDQRSFSLNGAAAAIDSVLANCAKKA